MPIAPLSEPLYVEPRDMDYNPFDGLGGLGKFFELFGDDYEAILYEMSIDLVA